jgi:hypothetical protein
LTEADAITALVTPASLIVAMLGILCFLMRIR